MNRLAHLLRIRRRREEAARRRWSARLRPWGLGVLMALGLLVAGAGALAAWGYAYLTTDLPSPDALPDLLDAPNGVLLAPTRYLAADGAALTAPQDIPPLALDDLPPHAADAVVSAIEPNFWEENGYAGHFWQADAPLSIAERLAEQLLLFDEPPSLRRRLRARVLASQMLAQYGHRRVLTWYLNIAPFGHGFYGLEAASRGYLGKPAAQLSLSEAALLAATLPNPDLNPWDAPELADQRRQRLLMDMLAHALLTAPDVEQALPQMPAVAPPPEQPAPPAIVALARAQVAAHWPLPARGLTVTTTQNAALQAQTDCLRAAVRHASPEAADEACPAARFLPPLLLETPLPADTALEAVVLDATTGDVLALSPSQGTLPAHAPGTALAPWVYTVAFSRGFAPASLTWDVPTHVPAGVQLPQPVTFHGPMRLRLALANDYLVPALHLLDQLGPQTVWATAARIGLPALQGQQQAGYNLLLDAGRLDLLALAHGYAAFAAQGRWHGFPAGETLQPVAVRQAVDARGNLRVQAPATYKGVLSPSLAYLLNHVLTDQAAKWPSLGHPNPLEIGRPLAAHVGRNAEGGVWVVGYTPQRVIAVYAQGADATQSRNAALAYWHALARTALADLPPEDWPRPADVAEVTVCDPSGMLPTADCPNLVDEVFLQGTEPTATDTLYQRLPIDSETGLRATVFTPPQQVAMRVFMMVPPEARTWAEEAGLPLPPQDYDIVHQPPPDPDVHFDAPAPFAYVRDTVVFRGTATGEDFAGYRIQVGAGLNPQQWIVVAEGSQPVRDGDLGTWDTRGLRGLYAVQLQVTDTRGRVRTATLQITVDDQPPQVAFLHPQEADVAAAVAQGYLIVQAEAEDDLAMGWVRLTVDDAAPKTLYAPPYTFALRLDAGEHTLTLTAADAAGNLAETSLSITLPAP